MGQKVKLTAVFISIGVLAIIFFVLKLNRTDINEPLKAIPNDAAMIFQVNQPNKLIPELLVENNNWKALMAFNEVRLLHKKLQFLDSLASNHTELEKVVKHNPFLLSLHETGKSHFDALAIFQLPKNIAAKKAMDNIKTCFPENSTFRERKYENAQVIEYKQNGLAVSFTVRKGLLLVSTSSILLEDAIRQMYIENNLLKDPGFSNIIHTTNQNAEASVFIQVKNVDKTMHALFETTNKSEAKMVKHFATWSAMDIKLQQNYMVFTGYTYASDSLHQFLSYFSKYQPAKSSLTQVLPANTVYYTRFIIDDVPGYLKFLEVFNKKNGVFRANTLAFEETKAKYGVDLLSFIEKNFDNEFAVSIQSNGTALKENEFTYIYKNQGNTQAVKALEEIVQSVARAENKPFRKYENKLKIDNNTHYTIYEIPFTLLGEYLVQPIAGNQDKMYVTTYDNYYVFSPKPRALENFLTNNTRRNNLIAQERYGRVDEFFPTRSNVQTYIALPQVIYAMQDRIKPVVYDSLTSNLLALSEMGSVGASFYASNGMLNTTLSVTKVPKIEKNSATLWETYLDTVADFKPVLVENHYSGENEIFIQDQNNTIYLINKAGRILWKLPLSEKITSEVHQIDYYKNGKFQMLFSTANYLHLFDRLGNYVDNYPIRLRSKSEMGMSLFDYDSNQQYRICLPTESRKVYMYNIEGDILKGWDFPGTDHQVISKAQHVRYKRYDYIVLADEKRVYILNRRGEERVTPKEQYALSGNAFYLSGGDKISNTSLVTTGANGAVIRFYLTGDVEKTEVANVSGEHHYMYHNLDGKDGAEHIFSTPSGIFAFHENGKKMFDYQAAENPLYQQPIIFDFGPSDQRIGIADKTNNKIYLITHTGGTYRGFPLEGHAPFTIGFLNKGKGAFNLIVPNKNNFLLNYAVH